MAAILIDTYTVSSKIRSPPEKFYNFFKSHREALVSIVPTAFISYTLLIGEEGKVGCVEFWKYKPGSIPLSAIVKLVALDDNSIKFAVLEGDLLKNYQSFSITLQFIGDTANCTFEYTGGPEPDECATLFTTTIPLVDDYLPHIPPFNYNPCP